jgi:hypothetical protein
MAAQHEFVMSHGAEENEQMQGLQPSMILLRNYFAA